MVVAVIVIIAAPFMHPFAHVMEAEPIRVIDADPQGTAGFLIASLKRLFPRRRVAPRILCAIKSAACGSLPLGFCGKTKYALQFLAQPAAIRHRLDPTDTNRRLVRIGKHRVAPKWRR